MRVVPGLLTAQHQGGGKADQLFLRGFDADHGTDVALYLDGVPINLPSHAHGQGYADLNFVIPEAIDHIDVEKGPYDARWGDFATAGAVNLVTREKFDESSVQYTLGMFPTVAHRAVAQGRFVGIAAPSLPGWAAKLHPWIAFEAGYDQGPFVRSEELTRYNLFAKLSYELGPHTLVGLFFQAYGSGWIGSGQIPQREVAAGRLSQFGSEDPSEGGLTERQMVTAFFHHRGGNQELDATAYVTRYRLSLWNDFTFFLQDPVNGDEIEQDDARLFGGGKLAWHFHRRWRGLSLAHHHRRRGARRRRQRRRLSRRQSERRLPQAARRLSQPARRPTRPRRLRRGGRALHALVPLRRRAARRLLRLRRRRRPARRAPVLRPAAQSLGHLHGDPRSSSIST